MNTPPTTLPDPLVSGNSVDRTFANRRVLRGLSFALPRTGIAGLVGRNGVGKTTLMGILAGQLRATGGAVTVTGENPFDNATAMDRICFTGVDVLYPPQWSVSTVLSVAAARYPYWDNALAEELCARVDVARFGRMVSLSTGAKGPW